MHDSKIRTTSSTTRHSRVSLQYEKLSSQRPTAAGCRRWALSPASVEGSLALCGGWVGQNGVEFETRPTLGGGWEVGEQQGSQHRKKIRSHGSATGARRSLWFRAGQLLWLARNHRLRRASVAEPRDILDLLTCASLSWCSHPAGSRGLIPHNLLPPHPML